MSEKTVKDFVEELDMDKRHRAAHVAGMEAAGDLEKAKAGFVWIAGAWLAIGPIVGYVTWLVVR